MTWAIIRKPAAERAAATLTDEVREAFTWDTARAMLDGFPDGGLNIAYEAVDRYVASGHGADEAILWLGKDGARESLSYDDLAARTARFANVFLTTRRETPDSRALTRNAVMSSTVIPRYSAATAE